VQETWGGNPEDIKAGNSITRSIALQADGLMAAQMPALDVPTLKQARLYPDQPALDDQADASGMHGIRKESSALIPAREGPLQLPELRVVWWDLDSDSEKVATIPAQTLAIKPGTEPASAAAVSTDNTAPLPQNAVATSSAQNNIGTLATNQHPWLWIVLTGICGAGWLLTGIFYWRLRKRASTSPQLSQPEMSNNNAPELFASVMRACTQNDARAAYSALRQWIRVAHPDTPTIDQWSHRQKNQAEASTLLCAIDNLQRHIYQGKASSQEENEAQPNNESWNGTELANALTVWRKQKGKQTAIENSLPSLYPA
jgi:hypothetical protein